MRPGVESGYVPPLRFAALTRFYDGVLRTTLREDRWRPRLLAQAGIAPGHRVLDAGCGTGALALLVKAACPAAQVVGLDADAQALGIARAKAERAGLAIELHRGLLGEVVFEPGSFDRVVSSLVFHHLLPEAKRRALARLREWLRPGGELHVADWGRAGGVWARASFLAIQLLDGFENTRDQVRAGLEPFMTGAGFRDVAETHREATMFGTLSLYRAIRP